MSLYIYTFINKYFTAINANIPEKNSLKSNLNLKAIDINYIEGKHAILRIQMYWFFIVL